MAFVILLLGALFLFLGYRYKNEPAKFFGWFFTGAAFLAFGFITWRYGTWEEFFSTWGFLVVGLGLFRWEFRKDKSWRFFSVAKLAGAGLSIMGFISVIYLAIYYSL